MVESFVAALGHPEEMNDSDQIIGILPTHGCSGNYASFPTIKITHAHEGLFRIGGRIYMSYLGTVLLGVALFLLTSLLCWLIGSLLLVFPIYGILLLPIGLLGVVLAVDAIHQGFLT
ncbi:hypothetical protein ACN4EK_24870 [Pantanalinema rosaneae CENA516]|uniref:hypothetical protein n=1 Tax=Pantanalinema rosaneae TaxID=1620701 RepID=UPI003D6DEC2D